MADRNRFDFLISDLINLLNSAERIIGITEEFFWTLQIFRQQGGSEASSLLSPRRINETLNCSVDAIRANLELILDRAQRMAITDDAAAAPNQGPGHSEAKKGNGEVPKAATKGMVEIPRQRRYTSQAGASSTSNSLRPSGAQNLVFSQEANPSDTEISGLSLLSAAEPAAAPNQNEPNPVPLQAEMERILAVLQELRSAKREICEYIVLWRRYIREKTK
ncbi:Hypothetical predicted protein [Cloeon dipterum]|uniref:Uncharacterized protein n=1 Tax=Cloeon dipterum TaxID=197152 RepID=A0A8S1D097_9INSE|nr:Hypothetical predicted protein [Cloeon dipterum]